jgi:phosphate-selective porin OprO/OprP
MHFFKGWAMNKTILGKLTAFGIAIFSAALGAVEDTELLDLLLKKGIITKDEYQELRERQRRKEVEQAPLPAAPETAEEVRRGEVVATTTGGIRGRTADGAFTFSLGGRLHLDGAVYNSDRQDLGNGGEVRRAYISIEGTVWDDWNYQSEVDFGEGDLEPKDMYIEYRRFEPFSIRGGHFKEPFSLEELTTSNAITFMERSLPNAFAPSRNLGIAALTTDPGGNWTAGLGVFGEGFDDSNDEDDERDQGYGVTGRFTFTPFNELTRLLHLGVAASYRDAGDNEVRFRERPESHITDVRFVDTGPLSGVDYIIRYGAEAAVVFGPFSLQGEYIRAEINGDIRAEVNGDGLFPDLNFDGYYVYGSWFLTGESRPYLTRVIQPFGDKRGEFGLIEPKRILGKGGFGAVELALRYSNLDLTDGRFDGGEEDNITVGLNWYPTPNIRLMANYIRVDAERGGIEDSPDIFQVRGQLAFY